MANNYKAEASRHCLQFMAPVVRRWQQKTPSQFAGLRLHPGPHPGPQSQPSPHLTDSSGFPVCQAIGRLLQKPAGGVNYREGKPCRHVIMVSHEAVHFRASVILIAEDSLREILLPQWYCHQCTQQKQAGLVEHGRRYHQGTGDSSEATSCYGEVDQTPHNSTHPNPWHLRMWPWMELESFTCN